MFWSWKLIFVVVVICVQQKCVEMYEDDDDDRGDGWNRCPWIRNKLKNGRVKIRSRGRIAKFLCDPGYELAGKRFATCVMGRWNHPLPVCVSRGCNRPRNLASGRISETYRGAVLTFECLPGYTLEGSNSLYCDGRHWSSPPPSCSIPTSEPQTFCDFEDPDLCGWSHDPTHDFDWTRGQFATPSGHIGTGPTYDHTYGEGKAGFYMYIEASAPRKENDKARLFSPVFSKAKSGGCFEFFYHMFGSTTGSLRIFVKPESHVFGEMGPSWELYGDQGNRWYRGNVSIPVLSENFQIIIEAVRGTSYIGDTAIDDVELNINDCDNIGNSTNFFHELSVTSCRGRCGSPSNETSCSCDGECLNEFSDDICCSDVTVICSKSVETDDIHTEESYATTEKFIYTTPLKITSDGEFVTFDSTSHDYKTEYSTEVISDITTMPVDTDKTVYVTFTAATSVPTTHAATPFSTTQTSIPTELTSEINSYLPTTASRTTFALPETTPIFPSTPLEITSIPTTSYTSTFPITTIPEMISTDIPYRTSVTPLDTTLNRQSAVQTIPYSSTPTFRPEIVETTTRKSYNLRPRNRITTALTTKFPILTTTTRRYFWHSTLRPTVFTTKKFTTTEATKRTTRKITLMPRPSTTLAIRTTITKTPLFESEPTIDISSERVIFADGQASKEASTAVKGSKSSAAVVTVSVIVVLCVVGGIATFIRKRRLQKQSKVEDDSEMRFLSANEVMEFSDTSAFDRINVH